MSELEQMLEEQIAGYKDMIEENLEKISKLETQIVGYGRVNESYRKNIGKLENKLEKVRNEG
jgi:predicted RNase H-like nuclease (RuvC/YqgF family)